MTLIYNILVAFGMFFGSPADLQSMSDAEYQQLISTVDPSYFTIVADEDGL